MSAITGVPRSAVTAAAVARIYDAAAQCMWMYYREHRSQLVIHVREYREVILSDLIAGVPVETAFAPYRRPVEPAKPLRRAA